MDLFGGDDEANHDDPDHGLIFDHDGRPQTGEQEYSTQPAADQELWTQPPANQEQQWDQPATNQDSWPQPVSREERPSQPSDDDDLWPANRKEPQAELSLLPRIGIGILAGVVLIALGFAIARFLDTSDPDSVDTATGESADFDSEPSTSLPGDDADPVEPVDSIPEEVVLAPVGLSCVVDFAGQPSGAEFVIGEPPAGCPDLWVWNQYAEYPGDDLLPWTEGVEECWAGDQLVQMWIGIQISDTEQGWIPLTPGTEANRFKDGLGDSELFATASADAASVGSFPHADLSGRVFAVQLDLPEAISPPAGDKTHLGGCWQVDRTNTLGLQFYWPAGVDV